MSPLRARVPAALSLLLTAALAAAPLTSYADEPTSEPTPTAAPHAEVTWPEVTRFNPDRTAYVVEVHSSGYDRLALRSGSWSTDLPGTDGSFAVPGVPGGTSRLELVGCVAGDCTPVATSPELTVVRELAVSYDVGPYGGRTVPGASDLALSGRVYPLTPSDGGEVTWELVDDGGSGARWTGTTTYAVAPIPDVIGIQAWSAPLVLPSEVPDGVYRLGLVLSDDVDPFGLLQARLGGIIAVDSVAPVIESFTAGEVVYPARDQYRDTTTVVARATGGREADLVVLSPAGDEVRQIRLGSGFDPRDLTGSWDGRDERGRMVPEGDYTLELVVRDTAGNLATERRTVRVEGEELHRRTTTLHLRPADAVLDQRVGGCSELRSPSARGGRGSLGFYSQTRCRDPRRSDVAAVFGSYLPPAFRADYKSVKLRMRAGAARGARGAYLVHLVEDADGELSDRTDMGPAMRDWTFDFEWSDVHDLRKDRPYVIWHLGLTAGSRYDVQDMELVVTYTALD